MIKSVDQHTQVCELAQHLIWDKNLSELQGSGTLEIRTDRILKDNNFTIYANNNNNAPIISET